MKSKASRDLAAKVLQQITEHPETHRQSVWWERSDCMYPGTEMVGELVDLGTCGTVGCVAGWAVALHYADKKRVPKNSDEPIEDCAGRLLTLDENEWWLFSADRTHDEVTEALRRIVNGQPVLP